MYNGCVYRCIHGNKGVYRVYIPGVIWRCITHLRGERFDVHAEILRRHSTEERKPVSHGVLDGIIQRVRTQSVLVLRGVLPDVDRLDELRALLPPRALPRVHRVVEHCAPPPLRDRDVRRAEATPAPAHTGDASVPAVRPRPAPAAPPRRGHDAERGTHEDSDAQQPEKDPLSPHGARGER
jgi:hypothetical protein